MEGRWGSGSPQSVMTPHCTIVMYHYVREKKGTPYPRLKALWMDRFLSQLNYFKKNYHFVSSKEVCAAIYEGHVLPLNSIWLTFDDAYRDHYEFVFPVLKKERIPGTFFVPGKCIAEKTVLDVNKIHFILANFEDPTFLLEETFQLMGDSDARDLPTREEVFASLPIDNRFDSRNIAALKYLLQTRLPKNLRAQFIDSLFKKHVTRDERSFSESLYLNQEQILEMFHGGMEIGNHGYYHEWMEDLNPEEQNKDLDQSLLFFETLGMPLKNWIMCYPFGSWNPSLVSLLKKKGCLLGLTSRVGKAELSLEKAFCLKRLDTNDLPSAPNRRAIPEVVHI